MSVLAFSEMYIGIAFLCSCDSCLNLAGAIRCVLRVRDRNGQHKTEHSKRCDGSRYHEGLLRVYGNG